MEHWFWAIFSLIVITWYIVVTVVVGIQGGKDIKEMIAGFKQKHKQANE